MGKGLSLAAFALLAAVVGFVVFRSDADERLLGTWEVDLEALQQTPQFQEADEYEREMGLQMIRAMGIRITFTEDTVRLGGPLAGMTKDRELDYRVVASDAGSVTVEFDRDGRSERHVFRVDGDRLSLHHDGRLLPLRRTTG